MTSEVTYSTSEYVGHVSSGCLHKGKYNKSYVQQMVCSVPKPESDPRSYPNPRITEDNPGSDPLDPGDHRPGPPVPPRYPRGV